MINGLPRAQSLRAQVVVGFVVLGVVLPLFIIAGCTKTADPLSFTATPFIPGPRVNFQRPEDGSVVPLNQRVSVYAIIQDNTGVMRADFVVDGVIVDTKPLAIASRRFDYLYNWQPDSMGQHALTIIGYNVNNVPGSAVTHFVNISNPLPGPNRTLTPTPWVIVLTATPRGPRSPTPTPWIIVVTSTALPTAVPSATPYYVVVTSTPPVPTQTPYVIVVTSTPIPPTPTPQIIVVPFGQ